MEYGPDTTYREREQPTAADFADARAREAKEAANVANGQMYRLLTVLSHKGMISSAEVQFIVGGT